MPKTKRLSRMAAMEQFLEGPVMADFCPIKAVSGAVR